MEEIRGEQGAFVAHTLSGKNAKTEEALKADKEEVDKIAVKYDCFDRPVEIRDALKDTENDKFPASISRVGLVKVIKN